MRCADVIRKLEELSPLAYAESWDNPGLLAGRTDKEIKKGTLYENAKRMLYLF